MATKIPAILVSIGRQLNFTTGCINALCQPRKLNHLASFHETINTALFSDFSPEERKLSFDLLRRMEFNAKRALECRLSKGFRTCREYLTHGKARSSWTEQQWDIGMTLILRLTPWVFLKHRFLNDFVLKCPVLLLYSPTVTPESSLVLPEATPVS